MSTGDRGDDSSRRCVYLGLGSNLGDRWALLADAVSALEQYDADLLVSPIYETSPVGGPVGQDRFLNCVMRLRVALSPMDLLRVAREAEADANRVRAVRFGPRTLDVDVLLIEGFTSDDPELTVPHPRMYERAFVLAPLEDLAPDLVPPRWREHLRSEPGDQAIRRVGELVRSDRS